MLITKSKVYDFVPFILEFQVELLYSGTVNKLLTVLQGRFNMPLNRQKLLDGLSSLLFTSVVGRAINLET
jgi:hypothetical protein